MRKDEKRDVENYINEMHRRMQLACESIRKCNYGCALDLLTKEMPPLIIYVDSSDSYKLRHDES